MLMLMIIQKRLVLKMFRKMLMLMMIEKMLILTTVQLCSSPTFVPQFSPSSWADLSERPLATCEI